MTEGSVHLAQVRWSDPDMLGHINHARYLWYFEDARMAMLAGSPSSAAGGRRDRGVIAARVAVDYLYPVEFRPGLTLRVESGVGRIGTTSWTILSQLLDAGSLVARAEVVLVGYSYAARSKRPLDEDERAYWTRYLA